MTPRGDRQFKWNQRKRASDLLCYLLKKGYVVDGTISTAAVNAVQNWFQRERHLGQQSARKVKS